MAYVSVPGNTSIPKTKLLVHPKDGDRSNCMAANLQWRTQSDMATKKRLALGWLSRTSVERLDPWTGAVVQTYQSGTAALQQQF